MSFSKRNIIKTIALVGLSSCIVGCEKDNFTDPNDGVYQNEDEIVLNFNETFQTIDHFGASGGFQDQWVGQWPEQSKSPIAKLLFSSAEDEQGNPEGIALSLWRTVIGDGAADQINSGFSSSAWFRETACYLNSEGEYDWSKQQGEQWFLAQAQQYGVNKFAAWATTPPYFLTENGYTFRTQDVNGFNCPVTNYEAYAQFLANVMNHYNSLGYNFETVSPFNETQYDWNATVGEASQSGTAATNTQMANFLRIADEVFTTENVSAKMMISEAAQLKDLYEGSSTNANQLESFFNESSSNYIGDLSTVSQHIAGHSYYSNATSNGSVMQRTSLRDKLQQVGSGLDYWQSEYSILGGDYLQGASSSDLDEIDYALWLSRIIHTDLVYGNATGWSFWTALNQSNYDDHPYRFNLIFYQPNANGPSQTDGTFYDVKNLWALGNFSRFVRPGMVRFQVQDPAYPSATNAVERFMISGYKGDNTVVIVAINNTDTDRTINFNGYGSDFSFTNNSMDMYTTSATQDLEKSEVQASEIVIPAKSIVTLQADLD